MDRPLHVRVAEALGWTPWDHKHLGMRWKAPGDAFPHKEPPHYDTDWGALGPELVRYGIGVCPVYERDRGHASTFITACTEYCSLPLSNKARFGRYRQAGRPMACADGDTPLVAACLLIVALAEKGDLKPLPLADFP